MGNHKKDRISMIPVSNDMKQYPGESQPGG